MPTPFPAGLKGWVLCIEVVIPPAALVMLIFEEEEGACCERGIRGGRGGRYSGRSIGARLVAVRVLRGVNPVVVANNVGFDRGTKSSPAGECVFRNIRCFVVSAVCDMDR